MKYLKLADHLNLPADEAAAQTFAWLGRKGSGKTYGVSKFVELLLDAGNQVVIFDTVGNWYGLRLAADGKSPAFEIPVFGGLRGDIPLAETSGHLMANTLVDTERSAILDVSLFSKAARQRFATAFGERLWLRKKGERDPAPMHLVLEESQLIVPQDVGKADATMVGIYEEIVRLGRNFGIGVSMVSQRPQSVNKEVLNQAECMFVFQTNGFQEREALRKWVVTHGADVDLVKELPALPVGTAYAWSPQWLQAFHKVTIAPKKTFDSTATPRAGAKRRTRDLAPLNLEDLQKAMAATIEEQSANDPKKLKAQITELQKQLKAKTAPPKPVVDQASIDKAVKAAAVEWQKMAAKMQAGIKKAFEALSAIPLEQFKLPDISLKTPDSKRTEFAPKTQVLERNAEPKKPAKTQIHESMDEQRGHRSGFDYNNRPATGDLPKGEAITLRALIQFENGLRREQLTVLTTYTRSSRNTYLQRLGAKGLVEQRGELMCATDAGRAALPDAEPLPMGEELQEYWLARLPAGEKVILRLLLSYDGEPIERESIDEPTGYTRSSRNTYLQRLGAKELIVVPGDGLVAASPNLF